MAENSSVDSVSRSNRIFVILYTVMLIAVLGLCIFYVVFAHQDTLSNLPEKSTKAYVEDQKVIAKALKKLENKRTPYTEKERDEIIETVRCSQIMVLRQQEILVDDFRQEMNNNINKMNTWLAFGIGIMSVIGIFIPLGLQYQSQRQLELRLISMSEREEEKSERLRIVIKEEQKKSNDEVEVRKAELDLLKKELEDRIRLAEVASHYNALYIGTDTNILSAFANRENIFHDIWNRALESFQSLSEECLGENGKLFREQKHIKIHLIEGLIKLHGLLNMLKNHRGVNRHRDIWKLCDRIQLLIVEIEAAPYTFLSGQLIQKELRSILADIHRINFHLPLSH